jgi:VWFA-related protein
MTGMLVHAGVSPAAGEGSVRVTGQGAAAGAEVVVNQIDSGRFPQVTVFATVLRAGEPVKGLTAADFRVREDEVDQSPLTVEPRLTPLFAVVTLDTSGSMRQRLPDAKAAAQAFVDSLGAQDRVRALSFARSVTALNGPGADREAAKSGLSGTVARGDTALYDALYTSVELTKEQPGRKAVVLLSDGVDDDGTGRQLSKRSLGEALDLARAVNVPIYVIGLGTEIDDGILRRVAEETGGQYYKAPDATQLRELYARIGEQLAGQYAISYESNLPADGADHRISVTVGAATGAKLFRPAAGSAPASEARTAVVSPEGRVTGGTRSRPRF